MGVAIGSGRIKIRGRIGGFTSIFIFRALVCVVFGEGEEVDAKVDWLRNILVPRKQRKIPDKLIIVTEKGSRRSLDYILMSLISLRIVVSVSSPFSNFSIPTFSSLPLHPSPLHPSRPLLSLIIYP